MSTDETMVTGMKHSLFVLKSLVSKDFKLKYRRSILGVLWSVLNPLLMMIVLRYQRLQNEKGMFHSRDHCFICAH